MSTAALIHKTQKAGTDEQKQDKQAVACPCRGILLERKRNAGTCQHTDEPEKQRAKSKKPGTKVTHYVIPRVQNTQNWESRRDRAQTAGCQNWVEEGMGDHYWMAIGLSSGRWKRSGNVTDRGVAAEHSEGYYNRYPDLFTLKG